MVIFDKKTFDQKYKDKKKKFFTILIKIAKPTFIKSLSVLQKSVKENDFSEWFGTIIAIKQIAELMFFEDLKNLLPDLNKPNQKDYEDLKTEITRILEATE